MNTYQAESIDFHSSYRDYEIFIKHEFDSRTSFLAYERNDIKPIKGGTLADVMHHIDVLHDAKRKEST